MDRLLTVPEAAEYLGVAEATLNNWRVQRRGPAFVKIGPGSRSRVKYRQSALDACLRTVSTADQPASTTVDARKKGGAA